MTKILDVKNLVVEYALQKGFLDSLQFEQGKFVRKEAVIHAVNDVSFSIEKGEVFSLVGESGCGKSTVAKAIVRLLEPKSGEVFFKGEPLAAKSSREMLELRRNVQMIFQDPYSSLNPRQRIKDILAEPLLYHGIATDRRSADAKVRALLDKVGLSAETMDRYPHQFSGGQRQRIGIARALSVNPELIIADEPVSALDVSIQAQILNLLMDLKDQLGLSILVIAHNLSVVKHVSDKIGIMYLGKIVEVGEKGLIFSNPRHPYTKALFSAVPTIDEQLAFEAVEIKGEVPSAKELPGGCFYHDRCPKASDRCFSEQPDFEAVEQGHLVSCFNWNV